MQRAGVDSFSAHTSIFAPGWQSVSLFLCEGGPVMFTDHISMSLRSAFSTKCLNCGYCLELCCMWEHDGWALLWTLSCSRPQTLKGTDVNPEPLMVSLFEFPNTLKAERVIVSSFMFLHTCAFTFRSKASSSKCSVVTSEWRFEMVLNWRLLRTFSNLLLS